MPGSNQFKYRPACDSDAPSKSGKQQTFFNLREQFGGQQVSQMPSKNQDSVSFAVSEDKINRRKYTF